MDVTLHLVLQLGFLFEGLNPDERLGNAGCELRARILGRHRVHEPLSPPRRGSCEGRLLTCLQMFEAAPDQPSRDGSLTSDKFPLQVPSGVGDVAGVLIQDALDGVKL